jgi:class 3 adenylate cyclase
MPTRQSYAFPLMFAPFGRAILASMRQIDRRADTPLVDWSDLAVSGLSPIGTVTLLLADVEGSTRLRETIGRDNGRDRAPIRARAKARSRV